jgi:tetratricopeptide (TPR) repeat protein
MNLSLRLIWLICLTPVLLRAESPYTTALKEGSALQAEQQYPEALAAYEKAEALGASPTEKGLAMVKRAHILSYSLEDHDAAMKLVEAAGKLGDLKPVAEVTRLQVRAHCLMKQKEDYEAAAKDLETALQLKGVDWAYPTLALTLGDCHRLGGKPQDAIRVYLTLARDGAHSAKSRSVAWLNIGMTYQYNLRQADKARLAYQQAEKLDPGLGSTIHGHLQSL